MRHRTGKVLPAHAQFFFLLGRVYFFICFPAWNLISSAAPSLSSPYASSSVPLISISDPYNKTICSTQGARGPLNFH